MTLFSALSIFIHTNAFLICNLFFDKFVFQVAMLLELTTPFSMEYTVTCHYFVQDFVLQLKRMKRLSQTVDTVTQW